MDEALRTEISKRLGAGIARERERAGMSQEQVADALGIGPQAVSRIERGAVHCDYPRLVELSMLFDVSISDFDTHRRAGQSLPDHAKQFVALCAEMTSAERMGGLDILAAYLGALPPRRARATRPRKAF